MTRVVTSLFMKCPYCAQEIEDACKRCPFCDKALIATDTDKWYFKTSVFVIAFVCVGPFAFPLLWFNSRISVLKKIVITIALSVVTYFMTLSFIGSLKTLYKYYRLAFPA